MEVMLSKDSFIFKLHAENRLQQYIQYVDSQLFGETFNHACSARAVLTRLAQEMERQRIDPSDRDALAQVNRQVALDTGHAQND